MTKSSHDYLNLGKIDERVLCFGGSVSNAAATEVIINLAAKLGINKIIGTGDLIAYCANPNKVCDLVRNANVYNIAGNCELSLANNQDDCGCGFGESSLCDLLSNKWYSYTNKIIDPNHREWFKTMPRSLRFNMCGVRLAVFHGTPLQVNQFIWESTSLIDKYSLIAGVGVDAIIAGHSGIPFSQVVNNAGFPLLWHNPGSSGMPANDGTTKIWYSVIDPIHEDNGIRITHHSLDYNYTQEAQSIISAGLGDEYAQCLMTGYWPSLDILPKYEAEKTGVALTLNGKNTIFYAR